MNRFLIALSTLTLITGVVQAEPLKLSANEMDSVTAGLSLPNGNTVLDNFDTPAPGDFHRSFDRSPTANAATEGIPASGDPVDGFSGSNEGPWAAHFMSPVIDL